MNCSYCDQKAVASFEVPIASTFEEHDARRGSMADFQKYEVKRLCKGHWMAFAHYITVVLPNQPVRNYRAKVAN